MTPNKIAKAGNPAVTIFLVLVFVIYKTNTNLKGDRNEEDVIGATDVAVA